MSAIPTSNSCYCHVQLVNQWRTPHDLSFSRSVSAQNPYRHKCNSVKINKLRWLHVHMKQTDSIMKPGTNGQPLKVYTNGKPILGSKGQSITMVPNTELVDNKPLSRKRLGTTNGSIQFGKGTSLVKSLKVKEHTAFPPSDESYRWANENYNSVQRSIDVWSFVLSLCVRVLLDNAKWTYNGSFTEEKQTNRRKKTASWLKDRVLQLGPTFIKLGQQFSSRSDLFPKEFIDELVELQDKVPAFIAAKAKGFIENELGAPVDVLFREFEEQPIAAASLGQVHRAILYNGEKVVVKVQRPGLKKLFDIDFRILKLVAEYFQRSETLGGPTRDWMGVYYECERILYQEIDYMNEGKNADRFSRDFRNVKWVRVPRVFWDYTTTKVLTLEYVPGIKINNLDAIKQRGYSRSRISSHAIESYLIQILKTGFFHADPHPGNIAIDMDESLIYYDFGMMGEIKPLTRERLMDLFYAVYEKDAKKVMNSLTSLEALQPTRDMSSVRRSIQFFLDNSLNLSQDQEQTLAAIGEDLLCIATDQSLRFPSSLTFLLRAFSVLEGIGYSLDPNFSFFKIASPYAQELLDLKEPHPSGTQLVVDMQKQVDDARSNTMSMPYRIQRIEEFVNQLEVGDLKLHVRVLESERASRKATILQMATMYTVIGGALVNLGVVLSTQGMQLIANGSFVAAGILIAMIIRSMQRVKN